MRSEVGVHHPCVRVDEGTRKKYRIIFFFDLRVLQLIDLERSVRCYLVSRRSQIASTT